jgi:hypothetical protein
MQSLSAVMNKTPLGHPLPKSGLCTVKTGCNFRIGFALLEVLWCIALKHCLLGNQISIAFKIAKFALRLPQLKIVTPQNYSELRKKIFKLLAKFIGKGLIHHYVSK